MMVNRRPASEEPALQALDAFFAALNAGDSKALYENINLPHIRISGEGVAIYTTLDDLEKSYLRDFSSRAGPDWDHSVLDSKEVIHSSDKKVHVFIQFTRCDKNGGKIATFRSLWIMTCLGGRWGVQARSSFAP
tara:strand:+ start:2646 stop:3047 length:402 start_codon:yes stop_codon:yes gene_type:complete